MMRPNVLSSSPVQALVLGLDACPGVQHASTALTQGPARSHQCPSCRRSLQRHQRRPPRCGGRPGQGQRHGPLWGPEGRVLAAHLSRRAAPHVRAARWAAAPRCSLERVSRALGAEAGGGASGCPGPRRPSGPVTEVLRPRSAGCWQPRSLIGRRGSHALDWLSPST